MHGRALSSSLPAESALSDIPDLITQAYQGSLEASPWQSLLRSLRLHTDSEMSAMMLRPGKAGLAALALWDFRNPLPAEAVRDFSVEYANMGYRDPLTSALGKTGGVLSLDQVVAGTALEQTEFYRRIMQPAGIAQVLAMHVPMPDNAACFIGMMRGPGQSAFSVADKQMLLALRPHLEHALKVHALLKRQEMEKGIYGDALDSLTIGTIVLDGRGRILEANQTAKNILRRSFCFSVVDDHLIPTKSQYRDEFKQLLNAAISWRERQLPDTFVEALRIDCPTGADIGLLIRTSPCSNWYQNAGVPAVIIYLEDFEQESSAPEQIIARLFGLTKSEARLAALLASGVTLTEAAVRLKLTESSVRTYSKKIFAKMGIGRQAELVRLILKSVALLAPSPDKASG